MVRGGLKIEQIVRTKLEELVLPTFGPMLFTNRCHPDLLSVGLNYRLDAMYEINISVDLKLIIFWECDERNGHDYLAYPVEE